MLDLRALADGLRRARALTCVRGGRVGIIVLVRAAGQV